MSAKSEKTQKHACCTLVGVYCFNTILIILLIMIVIVKVIIIVIVIAIAILK